MHPFTLTFTWKSLSWEPGSVLGVSAGKGWQEAAKRGEEEVR